MARGRKAVGCAVVAACAGGANLFVPALRGAVTGPSAQPAVQARAAGDAPASVAPLVGLGVVGAAIATGRKAARPGTKVARNFFGGGSTSYKPAFEPATQAGVQDPVGFWDPLGFSADKDEATFKRRRAVEIKHGRIAMYATMGYITPYYYKLPGDLSPSQGIKFADVPLGLAAISKVPGLGWVQIIFFIGLIEGSGFFQKTPVSASWQKDATQEGEPGNYGVGFPTFLGKVADPAERAKKLSAELANGRLAMMAIIGMFFQDGLTGSAWGDWALYTDSPLRAADAKAAVPPPPFQPSQQIGVSDPLGFFDPAGFSKVGDKEGFKNLRAAEIKHGRVAMMAALGAVAQHSIKFPGFEAVPGGMGAVTAAPGTYGFVALFLVSGALELLVWKEEAGKEAGDFGDPAGLGQYTPEMRLKELNNGRFAMFAAVGIIAADLATSKDALQQLGL
jgi:light-harvesting complex I chlorophyll a/b binding protein 1